MHPAWLIETLNLLFTVMPEGKQYVGDLRGVERWVTEIEGLVVKWEKETQGKSRMFFFRSLRIVLIQLLLTQL
jgi:hypothetical protein